MAERVHGVVHTLGPAFGFIRSEDGTFFFPSHAVRDSAFSRLRIGDGVSFLPGYGARGKKAHDVVVTSWATAVRECGVVDSAFPTFGFIRLDDGRRAFLAYSDLENAQAVEQGTRITCRLVRQPGKELPRGVEIRAEPDL